MCVRTQIPFMDLLLAQYVRRSIGVTTSNVRIAKCCVRDVKSSSSVQRNMRGVGVHENPLSDAGYHSIRSLVVSISYAYSVRPVSLA